jgi:hypothetical protein
LSQLPPPPPSSHTQPPILQRNGKHPKHFSPPHQSTNQRKKKRRRIRRPLTERGTKTGQNTWVTSPIRRRGLKGREGRSSERRRGEGSLGGIYMIVHFFLPPVRRRRAARVACSKTSLTPSFILAEHSRYFTAPILRATASPYQTTRQHALVKGKRLQREFKAPNANFKKWEREEFEIGGFGGVVLLRD